MTAGPLDVISVAEYIDKDLGLFVSTIGFKDTTAHSKSGLKVHLNRKVIKMKLIY